MNTAKEGRSLEEKAASLLESTFEQLFSGIKEPVEDETEIVSGHFNEVRRRLRRLKDLLEERNQLIIQGLPIEEHNRRIMRHEYWIYDSLYSLKADLLLAESEHFKQLENIFFMLKSS